MQNRCTDSWIHQCKNHEFAKQISSLAINELINEIIKLLDPRRSEIMWLGTLVEAASPQNTTFLVSAIIYRVLSEGGGGSMANSTHDQANT